MRIRLSQLRLNSGTWLPVSLILLGALLFARIAIATQPGPPALHDGAQVLTDEQVNAICKKEGCSTAIPLQKRGGVWTLPVRINGVITLDFTLDSGASEVAIPADVAMTLIRTGTITSSDFLPGKTYRLADGSQLKSARFVLQEMELGGVRIKNVPCSVSPADGDLLLGQSLLERLESWSLDNKEHLLIIAAPQEVPNSKQNFPGVPTGTLPNIGKEKEGDPVHPPEVAPPAPKPTSIGQSHASADFDGAESAYQRGDYAQAYQKFKSLAEQGDARAQWRLGGMYLLGHGVGQDYTEATKWLLRAAEQGNVQAQYCLGITYRRGPIVPHDYAQAMKWLRRAADQGDPDAEFELGDMYQGGEGVPQDFSEAVKWYLEAAKQGNAWGQFRLGSMYEQGHGVPQDCTEAARWYRKAAEQGNKGAEMLLGRLYFQGKGVPRDDAEGTKWTRAAAQQGDEAGQYILGMMYYSGLSVQRDYTEALKWWRKAAKQGNAGAEVCLGRMYFNGKGVTKDYVEAALWVSKAADQGDAEGQAFLAVMYSEGRGVPLDIVQAYMWINLAATKGNPQYEKLRRIFALQMTPPQIDEAQRLSREWRPESHPLVSAQGDAKPPLTKGGQAFLTAMADAERRTVADVQRDLSRAAKTADSIFKKNGVTGLTIETEGCYKHNKNDGLYCVYLDFASRSIDMLPNPFLRTAYFHGTKFRLRVLEELQKADINKDIARRVGYLRLVESAVNNALEMQLKIADAGRKAKHGMVDGVTASTTINTASPDKWLVILGSDPLDNREKSEERLASIKLYAPNARIANSALYPRLLTGWWVVVEGPFDKATAEQEKARLLRVVPDAFVRAGW